MLVWFNLHGNSHSLHDLEGAAPSHSISLPFITMARIDNIHLEKHQLGRLQHAQSSLQLGPSTPKDHVTGFQVPPRLTHRCRDGLGEGGKQLDRGWGTRPPCCRRGPSAPPKAKPRLNASKRGGRGAAGTGRRSEGQAAAPRPRRRRGPAGHGRGEPPLTWGRPRCGGAEAERIRSGTRRRPGAAAVAAREEPGRGERREGAGHLIHLRAPAPAEAGQRQRGAGVFPSPSTSSSSCARLQNKRAAGKRAARDTGPRAGGVETEFFEAQ